MSTIPRKILDQLNFFDLHQSIFVANAAAIGLSAAQATAFKTAAGAARSAYNDQLAAEATLRAAGVTARAAVRDAHTMCGNLINLIKGFADNSSDPAAVYALAQIPEPGTGSPTPPPGTPDQFTVGLLQDGSIVLKWKCGNPPGVAGTIYEVRRRLSGETAWSFVGATGVKSFTDDTIPSTPSATYQITAVRSTAHGNPAQFTVNFGVGGDGLAFASVSVETPAKMAA